MKQYPSLHTQTLWSHPKSVTMIGSVLLLVSLALVYFWMQIFFLFAIELPVNGIGMSNICAWQYSFSNDFVWSGHSNTPFLIFVHMMAFLFIGRLWRKKHSSILPLEFGVLNILFIVAGTCVFILMALINIVVLIIPGGAGWTSALLDCEPTFLAVPGIVTTPLMILVLVYSQTTGWLAQKLAPSSAATELNDEKITAKDVKHRNVMLSGGILLLLLALILLYSWLVLFLTYAIQLPENGIWACWGTGCERAAWQPALSQYFASSPGARITPFLIMLHVVLIIAFFRSRHKESRVYLPFEIGSLGILFTLLGTLVFAGTIAVYKMAYSPVHTVAPVSIGADGSTVSIPALPHNDFVARDDTGLIMMDPEDDLQSIYRKIPWEVNGKLRAWSGVIASAIVSLGVWLSMISGWLNRLIRRLSPRVQINLLLSMLLASSVVVWVEFYVFGFYLFW